MAKKRKVKKQTELERVEAVIFKHGGRRVTEAEFKAMSPERKRLWKL